MDDEDASRPTSRRGSLGELASNGADEHLNNYVESQLQRVRSSASLGAFEDELEAQAEENGQNGRNGRN